MDRLNEAARRPTPYSSAAYIQAFLENDEYAGPGSEPWLLVARRGHEPVGLLPLRRVRTRVLGLPSTRAEFLVQYDSDRPAAICRAADDVEVSRAFYRHLLRETTGIDMIEFVAQEEGSGLFPPPADLLAGWYARTLEGVPNATIPLGGLDTASWFRSLSRKHKQNVARRARKLLATGTVEYVTSDDPAARPGLLDLYLSLERRGWKRERGVGRHPARIGLLRALCHPACPHALSFAFLLLDGLPVAAAIYGAFGDYYVEEETTYDESLGPLSPGNLLKVLTVADAIEQGKQAMNLLGDFAYYKARWGAVISPTRTLQIFRRGRVPWAKARAGELRRRLFGNPETQVGADHNLAKREVEDAVEPEVGAAAPDRREAQAEAVRILAALRSSGAGLRILGGAELRARLPFE
ncbi:MAG TPA: GNAT family N-acetyltransferase [Anaeromyxobacteraceae bacterium]|nr:GNAT family N-acetyltransferase [Anaeromyxobacteraceae bacterium]